MLTQEPNRAVDQFVFNYLKKFVTDTAYRHAESLKEHCSGRLLLMEFSGTYLRDDSGETSRLEAQIEAVTFHVGTSPHIAILRIQELFSKLVRVHRARGKSPPDEEDLCLKVIRKLPAGQIYRELKQLEYFDKGNPSLKSLYVLRTSAQKYFDAFCRNHADSSVATASALLVEGEGTEQYGHDFTYGEYSGWPDDSGYYEEYDTDYPDYSAYGASQLFALHGQPKGKGRGWSSGKSSGKFSGKGKSGKYGKSSGPGKSGKSFGKTWGKGSSGYRTFDGIRGKTGGKQSVHRGTIRPCVLCFARLKKKGLITGSYSLEDKALIDGIRHRFSDCPLLDRSTQGDLRAATADLESLGESDWSQDFNVCHDGWGYEPADHWSVWADPPSNHTLALEARQQDASAQQQLCAMQQQPQSVGALKRKIEEISDTPGVAAAASAATGIVDPRKNHSRD